MTKIVNKVEKEKWNFAQDGEYKFHIKNEWRKNSEVFRKSNHSLLTNEFEFDENSYEGLHVLDLGCGSKLRSKFFKNSKIHALEPLASRFISDIPWCDLNEAHAVYSNSAEDDIIEIHGIIDLIFSINVIDHCFNFNTIINNCYKYLTPNGTCFLSFDLHDKIDAMHPIILTEEYCDSEFKKAGFKIVKKKKLAAYHKGISDVAISYWLTK